MERAADLNARVNTLGAGAGASKNSAEHPLNFCPVCSEKLEPKKCKLVCATCGYYLSCSDYY